MDSGVKQYCTDDAGVSPRGSQRIVSSRAQPSKNEAFCPNLGFEEIQSFVNVDEHAVGEGLAVVSRGTITNAGEVESKSSDTVLGCLTRKSYMKSIGSSFVQNPRIQYDEAGACRGILDGWSG